MRRLVSIAAVLLVIVMMLPVLACASAPKMTRMERNCCQQMHGKCGEMAKQGCCQIELRHDVSQLPSHPVAAPMPALAMTAMLYRVPLVVLPSFGYRWHLPDEHSPPGALIAATTVLRI